jgi:hypothetical protein
MGRKIHLNAPFNLSPFVCSLEKISVFKEYSLLNNINFCLKCVFLGFLLVSDSINNDRVF